MTKKDDKFVLMSLDDERSKKVAEVMGNDTCKKIIDFLADNKEPSEEDIAKALGMKINTVEYNLKKLLDSGLVEKTKNFFWSRRGKKIPLYTLANKHIVISPKKITFNVAALKSVLPVLVGIIGVIVLLALLLPSLTKNETPQGLQTFSSLDDLKTFLEQNQGSAELYMAGAGIARGDSFTESDSALAAAPQAAGDEKTTMANAANDYSETNVQVAGVDEPDIVKTDGEYLYVVANGKVNIVKAYPAEEMELLTTLETKNVNNIFVNGGALVVFSQTYDYNSQTHITVFDTSDKENPIVEHEIDVDGYYVDARMIDSYIYLVANQYTGYADLSLPTLRVDGATEKIAASDIAYFPYPDSSYTFTNIVALDLNSGDVAKQTYLLGTSYTLYMSENALYLTGQKTFDQQNYYEELITEVMLPLLPESEREQAQDILDSNDEWYKKMQSVGEIVSMYSENLRGDEKAAFDSALQQGLEDYTQEKAKELEQTIIHKISLDKTKITYETNAQVPGRVLNQFSMDEFDGNFRIATTTGESWNSRAVSLNHVYVLDDNLKVIGSVEDLAKGERIYSVRFMGERAYVVTFRQVDPLFVLDLSNPKKPEVLGELKITGYSSYLHPYDETHLIGIGKEASEEGRTQGLKIALFDVSDPQNPVLSASYEVQEQWSDSQALYDHKAFLFDKERNLLVLPVSYSKLLEKNITNSVGIVPPYPRYEYWQGAYVFTLTPDEITLRGTIEHEQNESNNNYYYGNHYVERALYLDDTLYTVSSALVKTNDLITLEEIATVKLPVPDYNDYPVIMYGEGVADVSALPEKPVM